MHTWYHWPSKLAKLVFLHSVRTVFLMSSITCFVHFYTSLFHQLGHFYCCWCHICSHNPMSLVNGTVWLAAIADGLKQLTSARECSPWVTPPTALCDLVSWHQDGMCQAARGLRSSSWRQPWEIYVIGPERHVQARSEPASPLALIIQSGQLTIVEWPCNPH